MRYEGENKTVDANQFDGTDECGKRMHLQKLNGKIPGKTKGWFLFHEDGNKPVGVRDWVVTSQDGTQAVIPDDEFNRRFKLAERKTVPTKPAA